MTDILRPRKDPARYIYDEFQREASLRDDRTFEEWRHAELFAVFDAAIEYARTHGLRPPTLSDVMIAEQCALGHVDYGAKWAHSVAILLINSTPHDSRNDIQR